MPRESCFCVHRTTRSCKEPCMKRRRSATSSNIFPPHSNLRSWRLQNERALSQLQVANNKNNELTHNLRHVISIRQEKLVELNSSNVELKGARLSLERAKAWWSVCVTLLQCIRECEAESVLEYVFHTARHSKEEIKEARKEIHDLREEIHDLRGNFTLGATYLRERERERKRERERERERYNRG